MTPAALHEDSLRDAVNIFGRERVRLFAAVSKAPLPGSDLMAETIREFRAESNGAIVFHLGAREVTRSITLAQVTLPIPEELFVLAWAVAVTAFLFFWGFSDLSLFLVDKRGVALQLFFSTADDLHWRRFLTLDGRAARG